METYVPSLRKKYQEEVIAKLQTKFGYKSPMQVPRLLKIVVNQGIGDAVSDKRLVENAVNQLTTIAGQKAVTTYSTKDISNFKLRKKYAYRC